MSLGGQELLNAVAPSDGVMPVQAYSSGGKGGALTPEQAQALQYYVASQPAVIDQFNNAGLIIDPTALAQQAILARPPRQYAYQPLLSRYVTSDGTGTGGAGGTGGTGAGAINAPRPSYTGLMYPSVQRPSLSVPSYTSRYDTGGSGGGGSESPAGGGYVAVPDYSIPVEDVGTYAGVPDYSTGLQGQGTTGQTGLHGDIGVFDANGNLLGYDPSIYGPAETQFGFVAEQPGTPAPDSGFNGNFGSEAGPAAGLSNEAGSTDATAAADNSGNTSSDSGGGKIVCTAMNQQYGFGSFRNAIWLKYAENNLTKAHEAGYHAIFLPLVDFAFKQGDGRLNLLTRKFLENCARHRSRDLRAEMRGTKRDTIGMIYRSVLEPLCYAVGKIKGY